MLRAGCAKSYRRGRYHLVGQGLSIISKSRPQGVPLRAMAAARRLLDRTTLSNSVAAILPTSSPSLEARSIQAQASVFTSDSAIISDCGNALESSSTETRRANSTDSFKELYHVLKQQQEMDILQRRLRQGDQPMLPPTIESLRDQAAALMRPGWAEEGGARVRGVSGRGTEAGGRSNGNMLIGEANETAFILDEIEEDMYPPSGPESVQGGGSHEGLQQIKEHLTPHARPSSVDTKREQLRDLEVAFEEGTISEALGEYKEVQDTLFRTGKAAYLPVVKRQIFAWYGPMIEAMTALHAKLREGKWSDLGNGVGTYGPFLILVPPDKLAVITVNETVNLILRHGNQGVPLTMLLLHIADAVRTEVNFLRLSETYGDRVLNILRENGMISLKRVNRKAREALEDGVWRADLKIKVGGMLLSELHRVAKISPECVQDGAEEAHGLEGPEVGSVREKSREKRMRLQAPRLDQAGGGVEGGADSTDALTSANREAERPPALSIALESTRSIKKRGLVFLDEAVYRSMAGAADVQHYLTPRYRPMVVQPRPWKSFDSGGYLQLKSFIVRSQNSKAQFDALRGARMPEVYHALNFLGRVPWVINGEVLSTIQEAYARGLTVGDLPSQLDELVPPLSGHPSHPPPADPALLGAEEDGVPGRRAEERRLLRDRWQIARRVKKRNAELFSLRCDTEIKLSIAEEFRNHTFYFPYNLDFRGRAYPVPPNLNHLGSDMCRGMLRFAEKRPLGKNGLRWLKIHLANLCGQDKLSFDDRVAFVEGKMENVQDSAARPLNGHGWWQKAEEPWQALAVCKEIVAAVESGDPESFLSGVPVHMDGSCNGLQHYAALGRDEEGAKQVNLIHSAVPRDVYTGVCDRVIKHVHSEATRALGRTATEEERRQQRHARLVDGLINRKVVKQTVMTSVYGVTYVGARKQIQARLKEKFQEREKGRMLTKEEEQEVYEASRYVATVTLSKLAELFSAARNIMEWLSTCASLVARQGQPMSWVTPLGLPVIQPYRRDKGLLVKTLIQSVILVDCNDKLPVSSSRQRSAFPPNFVHSLDSTHMLMTANRLQGLGVPFTAVHDSYWCHASNVEVMNATLRECFITLYEQPVLEALRDSLVARFPDVAFPPIPQRGKLRLEEVKDSPYFFD